MKDYSSVFHPCIACKNSPSANAKPIYGSKRLKRRANWPNGDTEEPSNTRSTTRRVVLRQRSDPEDSGEDETEPSGTFSEHSD